MEDALYEKAGINQKTGEPFSNPFKLSKICNEASRHCKETIKEAGWKYGNFSSRSRKWNSSKHADAALSKGQKQKYMHFYLLHFGDGK